ncbi:hypothetical protein L195_g044805 [Trifolium pratense]|uniref:Uncharacterized protein n=1 Tax=Trifolium pratense TaxID=57577 RepID=A0A2K3MD21_TRIPR|nr:hypothetical protein L195_g044805 [Trifolium pratense]
MSREKITNVGHCHHGKTSWDICLRCLSALETSMHVVRDHEYVQEVRNTVTNLDKWNRFCSLDTYACGYTHWKD